MHLGGPYYPVLDAGYGIPCPRWKNMKKRMWQTLALVLNSVSESSNKVLETLKEGVELIVVDDEGNLQNKHVDLSPIMSSFSHGKKRFYLHPEFVNDLTHSSSLKRYELIIPIHCCTAISRVVRLKQLTYRTSSDINWITSKSAESLKQAEEKSVIETRGREERHWNKRKRCSSCSWIDSNFCISCAFGYVCR